MNEKTLAIVQKELELQGYDGHDSVISSHEYIETIIKTRVVKDRFYSLFNKIDALTGGYMAGEVSVVSGYTGEGKSTFCRNLSVHFTQKNYNVLWFSYEDPDEHFFSKFGDYVPLFYLPKDLSCSDFKWIEERIIEAKLKFKIDIVIIDHLHRLLNFKELNCGNTSLYIGIVMQNLVKLAQLHNISIILIAHTAKIEPDTMPSLSSIRDSSFISQEASNVMIIWRCAKFDDTKGTFETFNFNSKLGVFKARKTGLRGIVELEFKDGYFWEK